MDPVQMPKGFQIENINLADTQNNQQGVSVKGELAIDDKKYMFTLFYDKESLSPTLTNGTKAELNALITKMAITSMPLLKQIGEQYFINEKNTRSIHLQSHNDEHTLIRKYIDENGQKQEMSFDFSGPLSSQEFVDKMLPEIFAKSIELISGIQKPKEQESKKPVAQPKTSQNIAKENISLNKQIGKKRKRAPLKTFPNNQSTPLPKNVSNANESELEAKRSEPNPG